MSVHSCIFIDDSKMYFFGNVSSSCIKDWTNRKNLPKFDVANEIESGFQVYPGVLTVIDLRTPTIANSIFSELTLDLEFPAAQAISDFARRQK